MNEKEITSELFILEVLKPVLPPGKYEYYKTDYEGLRVDYYECFAILAAKEREIAKELKTLCYTNKDDDTTGVFTIPFLTLINRLEGKELKCHTCAKTKDTCPTPCFYNTALGCSDYMCGDKNTPPPLKGDHRIDKEMNEKMSALLEAQEREFKLKEAAEWETLLIHLAPLIELLESSKLNKIIEAVNKHITELREGK